jgi:hypothetical protein
MPGYNRGNGSAAEYLTRILAALIKKEGGEIRVAGADVDTIIHTTCIVKDWDSKTQELVLRVGIGEFTEVFKVLPEPQVQRPVEEVPRGAVVDPLGPIFRDAQPTNGFTSKTSTVDNPRLTELEHKRNLRRAMQLIKTELIRKKELKERIANGSTETE